MSDENFQPPASKKKTKNTVKPQKKVEIKNNLFAIGQREKSRNCLNMKN
jgi:hypothetical protein